ncbi:hypothetical protein V5799_029206 [Amblyomma americanum]|uniref:Transposable element P transposase-like RNase H C-terminal domain-containing protein n=1 Tax=Amblyomma americanum TaxID=6943 RepID=A0AAQ4ES01_AMBAM
MTSRFPAEALRPASPTDAILVDFLDYLDKWEAGTSGKQGFLSDSTATGLRVTLASTLSLLQYLTETLRFKYLMTSRLSTDPVEHLFGIIRQSSGCNSHPSPEQFLITVNCLSFYNLARSVDGANATSEAISALLNVSDKDKTITPKTVDELLVQDNVKKVTSSVLIKEFHPKSVEDFTAGHIYHVYWEGDEKTKGGYYDAEILQMTDSKEEMDKYISYPKHRGVKRLTGLARDKACSRRQKVADAGKTGHNR